jgi:hypothetical protein
MTPTVSDRDPRDMPVRLTVGDTTSDIIGHVSGTTGHEILTHTAGLLREAADELERLIAGEARPAGAPPDDPGPCPAWHGGLTGRERIPCTFDAGHAPITDPQDDGSTWEHGNRDRDVLWNGEPPPAAVTVDPSARLDDEHRYGCTRCGGWTTDHTDPGHDVWAAKQARLADIDYRALLKRYMRHIIDCESVAFLDYPSADYDGPEITPDQLATLRTIEQEVHDDARRNRPT